MSVVQFEGDFTEPNEDISNDEEEAEPEYILEDVLADKRRKYSLEEEYVHLMYNDLIEFFVTDWDGKYLRKTVNNPVDQIPENDEENSKAVDKNSEIKYEEPAWKISSPDEEVEIIFVNGNSYKGRVSRKKMEGDGIYRWRHGSQYKGQFEDNKIEGKGFLEWLDTGWYEGGFRDGYRHGKGTMVDRNYNLLYIGEWQYGQKHGKGYCRYEKNDFYDGQWVMDNREGKGVYVYADGSRYVGHWKNNRRHGKGTMTWPNGDFYRGEWLDGNMHGYGEYTWNGFLNKTMSFPQEICYTGNWHEGMRHGQGKIYLNSIGGAQYFGEWKQNKKHGPGTIIGNNGEITKGNPLFKNDIFFSRGATKDHSDQEENIENKPFQKKLKRREMTVLKPEQLIPLDYYINRLGAVDSSCHCLGSSDKKKLGSNFSPKNCIAMLKKNKFDKSKTDLYSEEEYWTYNCITMHMPRIRQIYNFYSKLFCDVAPKCRLSMSRLSLWQLWRDCEIHKKMSLVEIDQYLAANETTVTEDPTNPFAKIEIWQLIHAFLELSWHFYTKYEQNEILEYPGILANGLDKFLITDIYPKFGKTNGILCQSHRDSMNVYHAFKLYKSVGESHTVKKCLMAIFPSPQFFKKKMTIEMPSIKSVYPDFTCKGSASLDERVINFFKLGNSVPDSDLNENIDDSTESLSVLRELGIKEFVEVVRTVCPLLKDSESDIIINLEYKLTFLEFLETLVLACERLATKRKLEEVESAMKEESEDRVSTVLSLRDEEMTRGSSRPSLEKKIPKSRKRISSRRS